MVDVGGQRSQRQKWFQCFDGITSILFMVSSSEYDQVLMEDRRTNRLVESMNIFETIVNNKLFFNVSIILFLNKMDLLVEKVRSVSIKKYFSDFRGDPHRLEDVQRYLVQCFDRKRRNRSKPLFHHFTTAIDTENIRFVFHAVKDTILQENLKDIMLQWRKTALLLFEATLVGQKYYTCMVLGMGFWNTRRYHLLGSRKLQSNQSEHRSTRAEVLWKWISCWIFNWKHYWKKWLF